MALHSRIRRINEELKAMIAEVVANEVKDPRLGNVMVTVTQVETTKDLHQAQVFVSVLGNDQETREVMAALRHSQAFIRHQVASRVTFRYMPDLIFKLDETGRNAANINQILHKIQRENPGAFVDEAPADPAVEPADAGGSVTDQPNDEHSEES